MASSGDDAADDDSTSASGDDVTTAADAATAMASAVEAADGAPACVRCSKPADYFLYEAGRVEKFVCWEHVSPLSAEVDGDPEETRDGRPVALEL